MINKVEKLEWILANPEVRDQDFDLFEELEGLPEDKAIYGIWAKYPYAYELPEAGATKLVKKQAWIDNRIESAKQALKCRIKQAQLLLEDLEDPEFAIGGSLFRPELYSTTTFVDALLQDNKYNVCSDD